MDVRRRDARDHFSRGRRAHRWLVRFGIARDVLLGLLVAGGVLFYIFVYRPQMETLGVVPKDTRKYTDLGQFTVTGYEESEISCGEFANGLTAYNLDVADGIVAVDPRVIRPGSVIYIEKEGYFFAADVGGLIKKQRLDIFFPTFAEARKWGRKTRRAWLVNLKGDRYGYKLERKKKRSVRKKAAKVVPAKKPEPK